MSRNEVTSDDAYESRNDRTGGDIPSGDVRDSSYAAGGGRGGGPQVVRDEDVEPDPVDARTSDSDAQLMRDDQEAINKGNIMGGGRTRGVKGDYAEPGDEEGLPGRGESGSSSLRMGSI